MAYRPWYAAIYSRSFYVHAVWVTPELQAKSCLVNSSAFVVTDNAEMLHQNAALHARIYSRKVVETSTQSSLTAGCRRF